MKKLKKWETSINFNEKASVNYHYKAAAIKEEKLKEQRRNHLMSSYSIEAKAYQAEQARINPLGGGTKRAR